MSLPHRLSILLVAVALLGACGSGDDEPLAEESPTPAVNAEPDPTPGSEEAQEDPAPQETATEEPADDPSRGEDVGEGDDGGLEPVGDFDTRPVESEAFPSLEGDIAQLVDVRVAGHDGFDRVVLEFEGSDVPSHRISFIDPPVRQDGSGNPVEVAGQAFLELRMTPASGVDLSGAEFEETYTGPNRLRAPRTSVVQEVVRTGDFEANLAWVIGMDRQAPFAVEWLRDPLRLVVDVDALK